MVLSVIGMERKCHARSTYCEKCGKLVLNRALLVLCLFSFTEFSGGKTLTRIVQTKYGKLQGVVRPLSSANRFMKPVEVFLGVPYATPPIGRNRFSPTRTPSPWPSVRLADSPSPPCPQSFPPVDVHNLDNVSAERVEMFKHFMPLLTNYSEDCLYLNIYAPAQGLLQESMSRFPVIVFIHGESYSWNSGNIYDGSILASYADLVVVTLNYRLGILGFLNANLAPHLSARVANYGLMDQIAALHWIQQNIAQFGGDPDNVTLFGQGTGAACIQFLITSPTVVPGLFHRTVLLSGSALSSWSIVEDPVYWAVSLARQMNCPIPSDLYAHNEDIVDCLRDVPLTHLMKATIQSPVYLSAFGPSVDGVVIKTNSRRDILTQPADDLIAKRNGGGGDTVVNRYDLMLGVVSNEALAGFTVTDMQMGFDSDRRDKILRTYVRNAYTYHLSEIFYSVVNEYTDWDRSAANSVNTLETTVTALSDAIYNAPVVQAADMLSTPPLPSGLPSTTGTKSYFYVFDYQPKGDELTQRLGSRHGEELPYVFGAPLSESLSPFRNNYTKYEVSLSEAMMHYIGSFASSGNPNAHVKQEALLALSADRNRFRMVEWEPYDSVHQKYLEIGVRGRMKNHYKAHQLSLWLRLIPELHRAGVDNVNARHNQFPDHNNDELYDGIVRADPLTTTMSTARGGNLPEVVQASDARPPSQQQHRPSAKNANGNVSEVLLPITTIETLLTTCVSVDVNQNYLNTYANTNNTDMFTSFEIAGYAAYSTALSVTIAIGCSLLILNILIFARVYRQRDKSKIDIKAIEKQRAQKYEEGKHYPSGSVIVDIERDSVILAGGSLQKTSSQHSLAKLPCHHILQTHITSTLSRSLSSMNNPADFLLSNPPNGSVTLHTSLPRSNSRNKLPPPAVGENQPLITQPTQTKLPQAAMNEMRV